MANEFTGFEKGVIGKKLPSDKSLNNMKKKELIELLHIAQHNYETLMWFYNNAVNVNLAKWQHEKCYEQIKWERDVALETLKEHGIGLGQKKVTCTMTDCFYNDNLECMSTSDLWNPDLLENCPDYEED